MNLSLKAEGLESAIAAYANAREDLMRLWQVSLAGELDKGVGIIQKKYRSFSSDDPPTPAGTRVQTGNLRSSYARRVMRRGNELIGEMGLFRWSERGKALSYGTIWELGGRRGKKGRHTMPRPAAGALNLAAQAIKPSLLARLERDAATIGRRGKAA